MLYPFKNLFDQNRRLREIDRQEGLFGLNEGRLVYKIARSLKDHAVVVEIGAYKGKSTSFIAEGLNGKNSKIYSIDTWFNDGGMRQTRADTFPEFLNNTASWRGKIIPLRGFSSEIRRSWLSEKKIDFLWIDGDHSYTGIKKDIEDWLPLVKKNCFVCFHDYRDEAGVKKAVDEKILDRTIVFVRREGNIFLTRKLID
ncbi:hypothetical protein BU251_03350 [Candidatus Velamenicoccus archaeovorus]|uniref:Class I SAM-dependent methyltransferase n=1 Tax=Velamenicoccus archaeovorus TaxID=1930593 RepID=A0A410P3V0_VELA1|nr:class I SAM-dependent methyltransferase [Candidatus Velamenicoccus archaeovorus]QAT16836.1 hypothetical protein BU251_03350 [Candidatus Velamenicoccus archaeovorus]